MRVVVIGAGAMGAMAAWRLAARGADVVVLEQFEPGTRRGSSHGHTRIFRHSVFEGLPYLPLVRASAALWATLAERRPATRLVRGGGLTIGPRGGSLVRRALTLAEASGVAAEILETEELRERYPQHVLLEDDVAVYDPSAGVLPAEDSILSALQEATADGAVVHSHHPVDRIETTPSGIVAHGPWGSLAADAAVVAAGARLADLLPELNLELTVERSMHVWFQGHGPTWGPDQFPVFVRESGAGWGGWGIGQVGDGRVKIGLTATKPLVSDLAAYVNTLPRPTPAELAPLRTYVRQALRGLGTEPLAAHACLNVFVADGQFLLGPHPADRRIVIAGAGSGHAFKHAPAIGEIAADLVLEQRTETPISSFSPSRFLDDCGPATSAM